MRRSANSDAVERRLWKDHPRARRIVAAAVGLSVAAAVCWIAFALLLSVVVARVFVDGGTLASVDALLLAMLALAVVRGALLWSSDVVSQRAAGGIQTDLRERLAVALVALGPTAVRGERIGDLVYTAGEGVDALDPYVTRYVPARVLAVLVPVLVAIVVAVLDPWSVLILLVGGPMLVLLLGLIGRRVRDLAERRERELAWMNAHFLDVLRGLPTLKMFGRSTEQAETIRAVSRRQGSSTMDVLRIAFQTTLVLEWGATAATALVAIETSVRLMAGGLTFERALAVLLLTPEFFLPLRRLSAEYHVGRSARRPPNASTPFSTRRRGSMSRRLAPPARCRPGWTFGSTTSSSRTTTVRGRPSPGVRSRSRRAGRSRSSARRAPGRRPWPTSSCGSSTPSTAM